MIKHTRPIRKIRKFKLLKEDNDSDIQSELTESTDLPAHLIQKVLQLCQGCQGISI